MIHDKREFGIGLALTGVFLAGLVVIFSPLFEGGRNTLDFLDGVFNSISKASAYYVPASREKARKLEGTAVSVAVTLRDADQASLAARLFGSAGAVAEVDGKRLAVSGDLGLVLAAALRDADAMFKNDGASVSDRHRADGRRVLHAWHAALGETVKELNRQGMFREAGVVRDSLTRSLEPAYNYYGVKAVPMRDMSGVALLALIGYVAYTIWYGYAILFLFEGWGLRLEH